MNYSENPNDKLSSKAKCYEMLVFLQLKYINIHDQEISNYIGAFSYIAYQLYLRKKEYFSYMTPKQINSIRWDLMYYLTNNEHIKYEVHTKDGFVVISK